MLKKLSTIQIVCILILSNIRFGFPQDEDQQQNLAQKINFSENVQRIKYFHKDADITTDKVAIKTLDQKPFHQESMRSSIDTESSDDGPYTSPSVDCDTLNASCIVTSSRWNFSKVSNSCHVYQDFTLDERNEAKINCMRTKWVSKARFKDHESVPFYLVPFKRHKNNRTFIGFEVKLQYVEFQYARFRFLNLHHCGKAFGQIPERCTPTCMRVRKEQKSQISDSRAYFTYNCELGATMDVNGVMLPATGDTYSFSICMKAKGLEKRCGSYLFLAPNEETIVDVDKENHQIILLVDEEANEARSEVIVIIPTSQVMIQGADILSVELLHDSGHRSDQPYINEACWHSRPTAAVIHVQNITFNKIPEENIKVRISKYLPSGQYQIAVVPLKKSETGFYLPMAAPSCSPRLERLDLGRHALAFILFLLGSVIFAGIFFTMYNRFKEDETKCVKDKPNVIVIANFDISEEHNQVVDLFIDYLTHHSGVDKMYYAPHPRDGVKYLINMQNWWEEALRDPKTINNGFLLFIPGPFRPKDTPVRSKFPNLIQMQMAKLGPATGLGKTPYKTEDSMFNLHTALVQKRFAVAKFPYSDISTLPPELPYTAVHSSVVNIPQETKELVRLIQRAEPLTIPINLQTNLSGTKEGKIFLRALDKLPKNGKYQEKARQRKKDWKTSIKNFLPEQIRGVHDDQ